MRKKLYLGFSVLVLFGFLQICQAGSISVTSNVSTATAGGKVTFYVNIKGAASWQISGRGSGATSNCALNEADASSNAGNINKTLSVTCNATDVGQISFQVSGNITDASGKTQEVSGRKIVVVQAPREKDSNNFLKSLQVKDYELSPVFHKETLEYSVDVPSTVNQVTIEGATESGYAQVSGLGEFEVNEGANVFSVVVTSETGVERSYKITINVKDENPIEVVINNKTYVLVKNSKNITKPELYEARTLKIKDFDIPVFTSDVTGFTLVAMKDESGNLVFAIYDEDSDHYELYNEQKSSNMVLYIMDPEDTLMGFHKTTITISDQEYVAFKVKDDSEFAVVYAMNLETGKTGYYLYHEKDNTFQEYFDERVKVLEEEKEKYKYVVFGFAGGCAFLLILCIFAFLRKPNKKLLQKLSQYEKMQNVNHEVFEEKKMPKKKSKKKNKKKNKEIDNDLEVLETKEDSSVTDKISKAEEVIRDYEKTQSLSKNDLEEKISSLDKTRVFSEEEEDEMYDLFEDDKKKRKK